MHPSPRKLEARSSADTPVEGPHFRGERWHRRAILGMVVMTSLGLAVAAQPLLDGKVHLTADAAHELAEPDVTPLELGTNGGLPQGAVVVSITFDDGLLSQVHFLDLLEELALPLRATFFLNSSRLNLELNERESRDHVEYAPLEVWQRAAAAGHEIGAHSVSHLDLACTSERLAAGLCQPGHDVITTEERRRQVCADGQMLRNLGLDVRGFAYPFGHDRASYDDSSLHDLVAHCGFDYGRITNGLRRGYEEAGDLPLAESLPPANAYAIRSYRSLTHDVYFEDVREWILDASAQGGGLVPLVFHHVSEDCTNPTDANDELGVCVLRDELEALLRWLGRVDPLDAAPDNVFVKPLGEVMRAFGQPGLALLANSGMEQKHSGSIARPNCFDRFNGRHESNFEWSSAQLERDRLATGAFGDPLGVNGHFEKLIPTSTHRNPLVRMTTRDDRCYLPVSPQAEYQVRLRARSRSSDGQPVTGRFVFRVLHLPPGGSPFNPVWTDWSFVSPAQQLGDTWDVYSLDLPPLPSDAVGLAFGYQYVQPFSAGANHEVWLDDFSVVEYRPNPAHPTAP